MDGLSHGEYCLRDGVPVLIEVAARGGGHNIASRIVPHVSGVCVYDLLTRALLGEKPSCPDPVGRAAVLEWLDVAPGRVRSAPSPDELLRSGVVSAASISFGDGDRIVAMTDGSNRPGYFMILGDTRIKWTPWPHAHAKLSQLSRTPKRTGQRTDALLRYAPPSSRADTGRVVRVPHARRERARHGRGKPDTQHAGGAGLRLSRPTAPTAHPSCSVSRVEGAAPGRCSRVRMVQAPPAIPRDHARRDSCPRRGSALGPSAGPDRLLLSLGRVRRSVRLGRAGGGAGEGASSGPDPGHARRGVRVLGAPSTHHRPAERPVRLRGVHEVLRRVGPSSSVLGVHPVSARPDRVRLRLAECRGRATAGALLCTRRRSGYLTGAAGDDASPQLDECGPRRRAQIPMRCASSSR